MTNKNEEFLPKDYKVPTTGGNYTKLEEGKTRLRILSAPLLGWVDWIEENGKRTPKRFAFDNKPEPANPEKPVKHFWAFKVWNYKTQFVQILELTQSGLQTKIKNYVESEDWGNPQNYDIEIVREGTGFNDTKYDVLALPPKDLTEEVANKVEEVKIDLDKLLAGLDPFLFEPASEKEAENFEEVIG